MLKCEHCGIQNETVKEMGYILCPECNKKLSEAMDAIREMQSHDCPKCRKPMEYDSGEWEQGVSAGFYCEPCDYGEDM